MVRWLGVLVFGWMLGAGAQTVQPVIAEYQQHGSGSFEVTNTSGTPMAVVLAPKSFSIDEEGRGSFRPLDKGTHVVLSRTSLRLEPRESATVFYKATAERAPAWMTVYASFTPIVPPGGAGLRVRIMLPHTIYLYQREPLERSAVIPGAVSYDATLGQVRCELQNRSDRAARAEQISVRGVGHSSVEAGGFPLLPHQRRAVTVDWKDLPRPELVQIDFPSFSMKMAVGSVGEIVGDDEVTPTATETVP